MHPIHFQEDTRNETTKSSDSCCSISQLKAFISFLNSTWNYGIGRGSCVSLDSIYEGSLLKYVNVAEGRDNHFFEAILKPSTIQNSNCI